MNHATKPNFFDYLVKYWVLIIFMVGAISTVTLGSSEIKSLKEAVKKQVEQNEKVQEINVEQKVLVERTKAIQDSLKEQKEFAKSQQEILIKILLKLEKSPE